MSRRLSNRIFWGSFLVLIFGASLLFIGSVANSPDRVLTLEQEAFSPLSPTQLDPALRNLINWPDWFHATWDASLLDGREMPFSLSDQIAAPGRSGRIIVSSKPRPRRSYPVTELPAPPGQSYVIGFVIQQYEPERLLKLVITSNTAIHITHLFRGIEWRIELLPQGTGTRLRGRIMAQTGHWRSRLFGILLPRYFLQQVFLPSVEKLAALTRPLPANPQLKDLQ